MVEVIFTNLAAFFCIYAILFLLVTIPAVVHVSVNGDKKEEEQSCIRWIRFTEYWKWISAVISVVATIILCPW